MLKKILAILFLVVLLLVAAGSFVFWRLGLAGSSGLEKWIGAQLLVIGNNYLQPKLSFEDLDYEYPGTVRLKRMRLTADDPLNPGTSIDILGTEDATLTLAEIPRVGKLIKIEKIVLNKPLFQAVAVAPGQSKMVGFSALLKPGVIKDEPTSESSHKLSDVFQIRNIRLNDGRVLYDPRIEGTQPMELDHIWTETDIVPSAGGSYDLAIGLNREPLFSLNANGRVNLDTASVSNMAIVLNGQVGGDKNNYLPPQLQKILEEYQVSGKLSLHLTGGVGLHDYRAGNLVLDTELTDANVTAGDYHVPVSRFNIQGHMKDRELVVSMFRIKALRGVLDANGIVQLNRRLDSDLHLDIQNMWIDDLFVTPGTAEKPKLAGRMQANMNAAMSLSQLIVRLAPESRASTRIATIAPELVEPLPEKWGTGQIQLDRARLVNVPVLEQLTRAIVKTTSILERRKSQPTEKVDATFGFMGDQIKIGELTYAGELVAARGNGEIALDQRLNLLVNGGTIAKLTSLLGTTLGGIINDVKPDLVTYKITGTIDEPKIGIILGGGVVQDVVTDAGGAAASGVGKVGKAVGSGAKGLLDVMLGK